MKKRMIRLKGVTREGSLRLTGIVKRIGKKQLNKFPLKYTIEIDINSIQERNE